MDRIANEQQLRLSECTDQGCAVKLGERLNAEKVIVGKVAKAMGRLVITAQLVDLVQKDVKFTEETDCTEEPASVRAAVKELASRLSSHAPLYAEVKEASGDSALLDAGTGEGLAASQRLKVFRSEVAKDPVTGRPLPEEKKVVGEVEVTHADADAAKVTKVSGNVKTGDYASVEPAAPSGAAPPAPPAAPTPAAPAAAAKPAVFTDPVSGIEFVFVRGDSFVMGDLYGEGTKEETAHTVTVPDSYVGRYEVTVGQFRKFVDDTGHRTDAEKEGWAWAWTGTKWDKVNGRSWRDPGFPQGDRHPVVFVSWNDATAFARWLSQKVGKPYRLPTEAEWEYAARGRSSRRNYWGRETDDACRYANAADQALKKAYGWTPIHECDDGAVNTAPAGSYQPNAFGLYDMMGNAWEWCQDWYGATYFKQSPEQDPRGPATGSYRVRRGGGWHSWPAHVRVTERGRGEPTDRLDDLGFRLWRTGP
jgi:formylglycine-generating enzyme required for sulfatase activity